MDRYFGSETAIRREHTPDSPGLGLEGKSMKSCLLILLSGVIAATFATTAMPAGPAAEKGAGVFPLDCSKWKDKARCAVLNQDIQACKDKTDDAWRECMRQPVLPFTPPKPRDCSKASNKELCESHTNALEACKDNLTRALHRKCMAEQLQAPAPKKN